MVVWKLFTRPPSTPRAAARAHVDSRRKTARSEFRDVVFEDVVFDNERCCHNDQYPINRTIIIIIIIIKPYDNYYYQTPHPQTPHHELLSTHPARWAASRGAGPAETSPQQPKALSRACVTPDRLRVATRGLCPVPRGPVALCPVPCALCPCAPVPLCPCALRPVPGARLPSLLLPLLLPP